MSERDTWATSPELYAVINDIWHPALDVCASRENAKCKAFYSEENDALLDVHRWSITPVSNDYYFCNAPGSKIADFADKAMREQERGFRGIMIFQAGLSSAWFVRLCRRAIIHPLTPRPNFVAPTGIQESGNPRDWMLAILEPWMTALPSACGIGHPFDWEETGIYRGVLVRPKANRRAMFKQPQLTESTPGVLV